MPLLPLVRLSSFPFLGQIALLYYLKIEEGLTFEASFDRVQGLHEFLLKSKNVVHKINGCTLEHTKITIKDTVRIMPLLIVGRDAVFETYKHILVNHIQAMLNFHDIRRHNEKLSHSGVSCTFKGRVDRLSDFDHFLEWKNDATFQTLNDQLPISVKVEHRNPLPSLWRSVSEREWRLPLWTKYIKSRALLDACNASVDFTDMRLFHKRSLILKRVRLGNNDIGLEAIWNINLSSLFG